MTLKIRLIKGKRNLTSATLNKKITNFVKRNESSLTALANLAQEYMRNYIRTHSRRDGHTGNLEENINIVIPSTGSRAAIYIGDKEELNKNAAYWYVLNYGATMSGTPFIPPPNLGFFGDGEAPRSGGGRQAWTHQPKSAGALYKITPKTFTPINYIEATANWLNKNWRKTLEKNLKKI